MELFDKFKIYKVEIEGNKLNSIDTYIDDLKGFFNYLGIDMQDNDKILSVNSIQVKQYISYLYDKGNSATTRNRRLTAIKTFYRYLAEEENLTIDYKIFNIKRAKTQPREAYYLDNDNIEKLVLRTKKIRYKALIIFILTNGARFSDILQVKVDDILTPKSYDRNGNPVYYVKVIGKRDKERKLYIDNMHYDTRNILKEYIDTERKKILERTGVKTDLLFISNDGNPLNRENFNRTLKICAKKAGIERWQDVHPHTLRHSFATRLLDEGKTIAEVRDLMGHDSIATTNSYVHSAEERRREIVEGRIWKK